MNNRLSVVTEGTPIDKTRQNLLLHKANNSLSVNKFCTLPFSVISAIISDSCLVSNVQNEFWHSTAIEKGILIHCDILWSRCAYPTHTILVIVVWSLREVKILGHAIHFKKRTQKDNFFLVSQPQKSSVQPGQKCKYGMTDLWAYQLFDTIFLHILLLCSI